MVSNLFGVLRRKLRNPHFEAKGTANVHGKDNWLDNDDIRPLKLADRTWNVLTYLTFWFSASKSFDAIIAIDYTGLNLILTCIVIASTVSTWYAASSAQALGLSMWESVLCAFGGQCLIAIVIVFNGRSGAVYHIAAFGVFGAWWPTFNRAVMAIVWNGVNAVQGGECIYVMLHTLSPRVANFKNVMGEGSALDSGGMLGLGIFWVLTCCFLIIPVPKMTGLVYAKLIVFIISAIAMCAWTLTMAGGIGPVARQPGTVKGSERSWLLVRFILLGAANCATFASNAADFQRYARKPNDVIWGNLVGFPISNLIVSIIGNLYFSAKSSGLPLHTLTKFLNEHMMVQLELGASSSPLASLIPQSSLRSLKILFQLETISLLFVSQQLSLHFILKSPIYDIRMVSDNHLPSPKIHIHPHRFSSICAVISIVIQPWYLLKSAVIFISFLASYQIFLSAITGVLLCHYFVIARGFLKIPDLYTSDKKAAYHYKGGWNWRAYAAYVIGIIPNFYGFLNNMGVKAPMGVTRAYYFAYPIGLFVSFLVYWGLCWYWPVEVQYALSEWREVKDYVREEERTEGVASGWGSVASREEAGEGAVGTPEKDNSNVREEKN
ncbi:uncharacterized protein EAF02_007926 [Botrytis sinoallii]|uniref:uncharacterized protein n=1 Tax=Botrytis sinoallii TaxID=1463999 RepID=UPI0018FF1E13|nr:uncharacterized protein EAF02_007926 [Botrytis sinoallii]KAF7879756.1 hypothetical protein EAF02_007926 [Botrytis sinoallii]